MIEMLFLFVGIGLGYILVSIIKGRSDKPYYYYKGEEYTLICECREQGSREKYVCYKANSDGRFFIRKKSVFDKCFKTFEMFEKELDEKDLDNE